MSREIPDNNLPVVLLHNIDPSWAPAEKAAVMTEVDRIVMELTSQGHQVFQVPVTNEDLPAILAPFDPGRYIVFNWCEELPGIPHSEARVPLLLEQLGYAYTGSPPETISLSWDKGSVKARLSEKGLSTPYGRVFDSFPIEGWNRFPAIVKPAFEHCSVGIDSNAVVLDEEALRRQVAHVREVFAQPALVEDFIDGREFHVT
ncbi:MAG: hypothetical protein JW882_10590, partial [Deltaproteobacteria bacterium]|nr:hypothetical protein [Deltaproteobacteria bacterium]